MKIIKEEANKKKCAKIIARWPEHPPNMGFSVPKKIEWITAVLSLGTDV